MKWISKEDIGIGYKKYKQVIEKYPVIEELGDFIDNYNDFMEAEYNSCEPEGHEMFKKIFDLIIRRWNKYGILAKNVKGKKRRRIKEAKKHF